MSRTTLIEVFGPIVFSFTRSVAEQYNPEEPEYTAHFSGPSIWNNLDEELKSLSLHSFKQTMKKRYVSTYG